MKFESTEQKVIYEKLMADIKETSDKMNDDYTKDSSIKKINSTFNIERLKQLQSEVNGYINTLIHTKDNTCNRTIKSHKKIIKPVIIFIKRVVRKMTYWFIEPICQQQKAFNSAVTPSVGCMTEINDELINGIINLEQQIRQFKTEYEKKIKLVKIECEQYILQIKAECEQQIQKSKDENERHIQHIKVDYEQHLQQVKVESEQLMQQVKVESEQLIQQVKDESGQQIQQVKTESYQQLLQDKVELEQKLSSRINILVSAYERTEMFFTKYLNNEKKGKYEAILTSKISNAKEPESVVFNNNYSLIDYYDFENTFRGTREIIKERQKMYLEYVQTKSNIIDLGCGRGEFLELLLDNGLSPVGVDIYDEFITYCNFKGMNVINAEAVGYVDSLSDDSVGAITAFHLIEHLSTNDLITLCNNAYKKLKKDGVLIFETPNPQCLSIFTNGFYIDPTHIKPVHPETVKYFLKRAGFKDIDIVYTEASKTGYRLPLLNNETAGNVDEFNCGINMLSNIIFGSMDYAVIANK